MVGEHCLHNTSRVTFSSIFITQNKVTLNTSAYGKHFQEDKQPPCSPLFPRPNDAVPPVRHSSTQSDSNELSAAAARNHCCPTPLFFKGFIQLFSSLSRRYNKRKVLIFCLGISSGVPGEMGATQVTHCVFINEGGVTQPSAERHLGCSASDAS